MRKRIQRLCLLLLTAVFCFSAWKVGSYYLDACRTRQRFKQLSAAVENVRQENGDPSLPSDSGVLPEYRELYDYNPHMAGWVEIPDTVIDYPVMQTPEDPEYYLHRDFDGSYNIRGCIFADGACDVEHSDNVTIYGHHMNDGGMFAGLFRYEDRDYLDAHSSIRFDSLTERRTYRVFAVFRTTATLGAGFSYHTFTEAADAAEFDSFIAQCKALSIHDTGITPEYGDRILCLSTCEYSQENGRFVVAAVLEAAP